MGNSTAREAESARLGGVTAYDGIGPDYQNEMSNLFPVTGAKGKETGRRLVKGNAHKQLRFPKPHAIRVPS
jgi:hypothetical protein